MIYALTLMASPSAKSQLWTPVLKNSQGDTIHYTWPPPDSAYVRNELIIYFRPSALKLEKLCYDIELPQKVNKQEPSIQIYINHNQRAELFRQRFYVDSLIADSALLATIKFYGGDTLRRMSITSPCRDTIAIAHVYGDTLKCYDYLFMVLHFNNDTNAINAGIKLNIFHQNMINWASLNLIYKLQREPVYDYNYTNQISLQDESANFPMTGVNRAWDYQIGNGVKVAVIDNGIDYNHCDLGIGKGTGYKVYAGWSYDSIYFPNQDQDFYKCSEHGTPVAGIIGAFTNYSKCTTGSYGVAGIAGGWGGEENGEGMGCQLIGLDIHLSPGNGCDNAVGDFAWTAFREACAWTRSGGSEFNSEIINFSVSTNTMPDKAMRDACNYAYQCGVSIVTAIGNENSPDPFYPAAYDQAWITSVGASNIYKARVGYSNIGNNLDFIAPGGEDELKSFSSYDKYADKPTEYYDQIDYSTYFNQGTQNIHNLYQYFGGTSAAAPHASGLIALLRADGINSWNQANEPLEPEDYEGMIKASCEDIKSNKVIYSDQQDNYSDFYDMYTGWGFIRADNLFDMIRNRGYQLIHLHDYDYSSFSIAKDAENQSIYFDNSGGPVNKTWVVPSNFYTGITVWKLETTIDIPGNWIRDDNTPLFVWGRSGQANKSGLGYYFKESDNNSQLTTYQSGYTKVTDGENGNSLVEGIYHNNSLQVKVLTYQYENKVNGQTVWKIPPDDQIGANISVFGVPLANDVNESKISGELYTASIQPNPVFNRFSLKLNVLSFPVKLKFIVCDILGNEILKIDENCYYSDLTYVNFNVQNFQEGIYLIKIISDTELKVLKFVVGGR